MGGGREEEDQMQFYDIISIVAAYLSGLISSIITSCGSLIKFDIIGTKNTIVSNGL